jgi:hypothetical protein
VSPGPSRLPTDMHHRPGCRYKSRLANVMPLFLAADCNVNKLRQFNVRGAATHQSAQIMVPDRKEASTDLAIGGDPDPAAMPAEGMGNRCNDSDFADPIFKSVTPGRFTAFAWNLDEAAVRCHALQDLVQRNHDIRCPDASFFERHEFDEAHRYAFFTRELAERYDLVVVEAAHQNAIDLHGIEPCALRGSDSGQDASKAGWHTRYPREAFWIHRVHADCDSSQAGVFEWPCHLCEKMPVGGRGNVQRLALHGAQPRQLPHELNDPLAQQRFAARNPYLLDSHSGEQLNDSQVVGKGQIPVNRTLISAAAVDTFVVAAVSDRKPQVGNRAAKFVDETHIKDYAAGTRRD